MRNFLQDVQFTWRSLRARPVFALTAIVTLALGIGINTAVFTLINAILLRPLPVRQPERLVELYTSREDRVGGVTSYADLQDLRRGNTSFTELSGHTLLFANLNWQGRSELLIGEFATSNYMNVLGIQPQLGRFFTAEEEQAQGAAAVTVIGHRFWQSRFNGDPAALGQSLQFNGKRYTIVGVMPKNFEGTFPGLAPEVWIPIMMADSLDSFGQIDVVPSPGTTKIDRRGFRFLWVTGRLKDGVNLPQAQSQIQSVMANLTREFPQSNKDLHITMRPSNDVRLNPDLDGAVTAGSAFLLAAVGVVLIVACTNVAGMFLARSAARRREVAIRLALGTGRWRLIRQLLTESLVIAFIGGTLGLILASVGTRIITTMRFSLPISIHLNIDPDWRVFLFTFAISLVTGVFFGITPAVQALRRNLVNDLKGGDDGMRGRRMNFRNSLVVAQLALSLVLLIGASLLVRSLKSATQIDLGFDPQHLALVQFNLGMYGYNDSRSETFFQDFERRVASLPGVEAVTLANRTPLSININTVAMYKTDAPTPEDRLLTIDNSDVDPSYFDTMHVPIVEGRGIAESDTKEAPRVAVVSQAAARRLWPGESAIGKRMRMQSGRVVEVVGVAQDYKVRTVGESPRPMIHFARRQAPNTSVGLLVRTSAPASDILPALRSEITALDPNLVPFELTTMSEETARSLIPVRAGAVILAGLGAFAVFLAGVGLYGLIAYSVSRRTREIGTRIALGATPSGIIKQVVFEGSRLLVAGGILGLIGAFVAGRLLESILYGISALDPLSFIAGAAVLTIAALAANTLPALAAARVDPIRALKID